MMASTSSRDAVEIAAGEGLRLLFGADMQENRAAAALRRRDMHFDAVGRQHMRRRIADLGRQDLLRAAEQERHHPALLALRRQHRWQGQGGWQLVGQQAQHGGESGWQYWQQRPTERARTRRQTEALGVGQGLTNQLAGQGVERGPLTRLFFQRAVAD